MPMLIVGVARNIEHVAIQEFAALQSAFADFKVKHWMVIESDSSDLTVQALRNIQDSAANFQLISLGNLRDRFALRTERLAHCRNRYLQEIEDNPMYATVRWVVVVDLDGTNEILDRNAVASCWHRDDWDVCCANQQGLYYDVWALRHPSWSPNDCWDEYRRLVAQGVPRYDARWAAVYSRMHHIDKGAAWIAVDSAFGGLAIYKRSVLAGARYCGINAAGDEVCEHVALHAQLRAKGGALMINPDLINLDESEHTRHARENSVTRWVNKIRFNLVGPMLGR